ncbi:MAG: MFS transporter [Candidatus Eremiobacterota bacterium]
MDNPKTRYLIEGLLFCIYFAFGVSWLAYAPLLPELERHFGVDHARGALLISLVSMSKAFVPILTGYLAARAGLGRALLVGAALSALALVCPLAPDFGSLLALRFLFGVGGAIVVTLMGAVTMQWFPREELPMINGLNNVAVNTGITVALFSAVPITRALGWRTGLMALGALSVLLAVLWGLYGAGRTQAAARAASTQPRPALGDILRRRETWWIALAFTGPLSLYLSLNTWLPTYYQTAFGLEKAAASQTTGLFNLVGIPVALLGGYLTARLGLRRPLIVLAGLLMPLGALGMIHAQEPALRLASAAVLGASLFLYVAPLFTIPMELPGMTPPAVALQSGVVFSVAYAVSFVAPTLVGWLEQSTGSFAPGLTLFALTSSSLALAGVLLPETGRRAHAAQPAVAAA